MTRQVYCQKLKQDADGLPTPPYPGDVGQRIFENISQEAWQMWQSHQTMLINEYRLSMIDPEARQFLEQEMQKFLFSEGESTPPTGFTPPETES